MSWAKISYNGTPRRSLIRIHSYFPHQRIQDPFSKLQEFGDSQKLKASMHTKKNYIKQLIQSKMDPNLHRLNVIKKFPSIYKSKSDRSIVNSKTYIYHPSKLTLDTPTFNGEEPDERSMTIRKQAKKMHTWLPPIEQSFDVTFGECK